MSTCDVSHMLAFLQEQLDKGCTTSTLKGYVAAIAVNHSLMANQSVSRNVLVVKFLWGAQRLNLPRLHTVSTWDLSIVLRALRGPSSEPLQSADLQHLSLRTALILVIVLVKKVSDLQALSVSASCLEFEPNDCRVVFKPRHSYVPKVLSIPFRARVMTLLAFPSSEGEQVPNSLCPVQALRVYVERSGLCRHSEQFFVCFRGSLKGCQ